MTTLPPPGTNFFPEDSVEKRVYNLVDGLAEYLPIPNDRNRLSFSLIKYINGEGDAPEVLVKTQKLKIEKISSTELAKKLDDGISQIKPKE